MFKFFPIIPYFKKIIDQISRLVTMGDQMAGNYGGSDPEPVDETMQFHCKKK